MVELTAANRKVVWSAYMNDISRRREGITLTKPELRAAIDAIDTWINDNQASFNSAIPNPARTNLSASQKAELLLYIVKKRYEIGV